MDVFWDEANEILIRADRKYSGALCGLCGNFDDVITNEFQLRDGSSTDSESIFVQNWRDAECANPMNLDEMCGSETSEAKETWAEHKCSVINDGDLFGHCHVLVRKKMLEA